MLTSPLPRQMVADIEIAQSTTLRSIVDVAAGIGLGRGDLVLKGDSIAKVRLAAVDRVRKARQGKLVLVTGTTPTHYGGEDPHHGRPGSSPEPHRHEGDHRGPRAVPRAGIRD